MKHLRSPSVAAIAVSALLAFASAASATELTSPAGTTVKTGTTIHSSAEGHTVLDSAIGKIECGSTVEGKTTNESGSSIGVTINAHTFTGCTGPTVHTLTLGTLSLQSLGNGNAAVTSNNTEWTVETWGVHCIFGTTNTALGTLTGGSPATLDVAATIPRTAGRSGAFCGSSAPLTGSYKITTPNPLLID